MRPIYATRFRIEQRSDHAPPSLEEARQLVSRWMEKKYRRKGLTLSFDGAPQRLDGGYVFTCREHRVGEGHMITFDFDEPDPLGRVWKSTIVLATDGEAAEFSYLLRVAPPATGYRVEPLGPITTKPPKVVRRLIRDYICRPGPVEIASRHTLVTPDYVGTLVDFIQNPERALPIVLVSQMEGGQPLVQTESLKDQLVGLAHVYEISYDASRVLTASVLGKQGSCFDGAVRVYWPGYTSDAYLRHPLYLPQQVSALTESGRSLESVLFRRLSEIAAARFVESPIARRLALATESEQRREVEELRARVREAREQPDKTQSAEWLEEMDRTLDQNDVLTARVARLEAENQSLASQLEDGAEKFLRRAEIRACGSE